MKSSLLLRPPDKKLIQVTMVSSKDSSVDAFVASCHPLSLPITHHCHLALFASRAAHLCHSSINGWLFILCLFYYPLHTFILISRRRVSIAFVAGCHPFLPPIASHILLLSLPATARLHRSPDDGWLLRPLPSVILSPLLSSSACAIIDALVANTELNFHQATSSTIPNQHYA